MRLFASMLLFACSKPPATPPAGEGGASAEAGPTLHGERPEQPVAVPDFRAVAHDGAARGPADLLGHPTVLWFYPKASTYG